MQPRSRLTSVLVAALVIGTAGNLLIFAGYLKALRTAQRYQFQAQRLQQQVAIINRNLGVVRKLVIESLDYSRRNPALTPLLQQFAPLLQRLDLKPETPPRATG